MLTSLLVLTSQSLAAPLHSGELLRTAHTLSKQEKQIRILSESSYGISDKLQIKASLFELLAGPNIALEYGILDDERGAFSVELGSSSSWDGNIPRVDGSLLYTMGTNATNRTNLGVYGALSLNPNGALYYTLSLSGGYDVLLSEKSLARFELMVDSSTITELRFLGMGRASWVRGWEAYRLELMMLITDGTLAEELLDVFEVDTNLPPIVPIPFVMMWWTF